jgi:hypothetical protein
MIAYDRCDISTGDEAVLPHRVKVWGCLSGCSLVASDRLLTNLFKGCFKTCFKAARHTPGRPSLPNTISEWWARGAITPADIWSTQPEFTPSVPTAHSLKRQVRQFEKFSLPFHHFFLAPPYRAAQRSRLSAPSSSQAAVTCTQAAVTCTQAAVTCTQAAVTCTTEAHGTFVGGLVNIVPTRLALC